MAKNTHLTHIEDLLVDNGSAGGFKAIEYLSGIVDMLAGQTSGPLGMQAKFDGAPAIICGIHPETKRFFVGTKSVFNKTPKINYTDADIQRNHSGGLVEILKVCLAHLPKLGIKTILQGDLAFTSSQLQSKSINGKGYTTFHPNTILYAIPSGSDLDKQIRKAKMGIMFHTEYKGKTIQDLTASFNPNMRSLKKTKDVWFRRTNFTIADAVTLSAKEAQDLRSEISTLVKGVQQNKNFLDLISKDPVLKKWLNQYFNREVRENALGGMSAKRFYSYVDTELRLKRSKLKTLAGQEKRKAEDEQFLQLYADSGFQKSLDQVLRLHQMFGIVKRQIVRKLESINNMPMFVADKDGYRVTAPEGFVAVDNVTGGAVKLVDRLEFSRNNFLAVKNWVKEDKDTINPKNQSMKSLKEFLVDENLVERTAKKQVRMIGGKRVIQWRCPAGYDKQGKNCKKRSGADALKRKRAAKIGARKRKATKSQANLKRQRSMKRRRSMNIKNTPR